MQLESARVLGFSLTTSVVAVQAHEDGGTGPRAFLSVSGFAELRGAVSIIPRYPRQGTSYCLDGLEVQGHETALGMTV